MFSVRVVLGACSVAGLLYLIPPAKADTWFLLLQGKVVMDDGSVPPKPGLSESAMTCTVRRRDPLPTRKPDNTSGAWRSIP